MIRRHQNQALLLKALPKFFAIFMVRIGGSALSSVAVRNLFPKRKSDSATRFNAAQGRAPIAAMKRRRTLEGLQEGVIDLVRRDAFSCSGDEMNTTCAGARISKRRGEGLRVSAGAAVMWKEPVLADSRVRMSRGGWRRVRRGWPGGKPRKGRIERRLRCGLRGI